MTAVLPRHRRRRDPDPRAAPRASGGVRSAARACPCCWRATRRCCCSRPKPPAWRSLAEFISLGAAAPVILFAPVRGAAVLRRPADPEIAVVAAELPAALAHPDALRGLADPTARQPATAGMLPVAAPVGAAAAIALAKLGRLLPAVLAVTPVSIDGLFGRALISVDPRDVLGYPAMEAAGLRIVASAPVPLVDAPELAGGGVSRGGLGDRASGHRHRPARKPPRRRWCGSTPNASPAICLAPCAATAASSCAAQSTASPIMARRRAVSGAGRPRHRPGQQAAGLHAAGQGLDTMDANRVLGWGADERNFLVGANMLLALGISSVRLLTNNPDKIAGLTACGVEVIGREAHAFAPNEVNDAYLATKAVRFGHMLD